MKRLFLISIFSLLLCSCGDRDPYKMTFVSMSSLEIKDDFWTPYYLIHKDITLPLAVSWTESHFDSPMVYKAAEGIEYSLQFEEDTDLKVKRSTWMTRLNNETGQRRAAPDTCDVSRAVSKVFTDAEELSLSGDGEYVDELEQIIYNEVLPGISLKGDSFFSDIPESSDGEWRRKAWDETPGSAMDLFRVIPFVGNIAYATTKDALWVNLYMGGEAKVNILGEIASIHQETDYPWDGYSALTLGLPKPVKAAIRLRIPSWCEDFTITVNGSPVNALIDSGYAVLNRKWQGGDKIELVLDMPVRIVETTIVGAGCNGMRAIQRGPVIYCMEEEDSPEGFDTLSLSENMDYSFEKLPKQKWFGHELMRISARSSGSQPLTLIPYFAWGNRAPGKMEVFIPFASE